MAKLNQLRNIFSRKNITNEGEISPLDNYLILEKVFRHLDLSSLKSARLVNTLWAREATPFFKNHKLRVYINARDFEGVEDFWDTFANHNLDHELFISFPSCLWSTQLKDPTNVVHGLPLICTHLQKCGHFVKTLRLEMCFSNSNDWDLFLDIIELLPNLEKLVIGIVFLNAKWRYFPGKKQIQRKEIKTIGIRLFDVVMSQDPAFIVLPALLEEMLKVFPEIHTLDLDESPFPPGRNVEWRMLHGIDRYLVPRALAAIQSSFILKKFRVTGPLSLVGPVVFAHPIPALHLCLRLTQKYQFHGHFLKVSDLSYLTHLLRCPETLAVLERLDVTWIPDTEPDERDEYPQEYLYQTHLPQLPLLQELSYATTGSLRDQATSLEKIDALNIRDLIFRDTLLLMLPELRSLSIYLPREDSDEIWDHFFPSFDFEGNPTQNLDLRRLTLSIIGDCSSPRMSRIIGLFPLLEVFAHRREFAEDPSELCIHFLQDQLKFDGKSEILQEEISKLALIYKVENFPGTENNIESKPDFSLEKPLKIRKSKKSIRKGILNIISWIMTRLV